MRKGSKSYVLRRRESRLSSDLEPCKVVKTANSSSLAAVQMDVVLGSAWAAMQTDLRVERASEYRTGVSSSGCHPSMSKVPMRDKTGLQPWISVSQVLG